MKYNKILTALLSLLFIGTVSCTDEWNDHYRAESLGEGSLWQAISANPDLTNFAKVLKATGYDKSLEGSQVFTVFAPTNDCFTAEQADAVIEKYNTQLAQGLKGEKNAAIKEFVMNHIALYNYSVAPETPDTTIRVMNGKYLSLTHDSFSGKTFTKSNIATGNGVLFTIGETADYVPNIFEYLKMDEDFDSVANFLYMNNPWQFHVEEFQASQSVPGEIINGQQHYLDSVTMVKNELLRMWLDAELNNEDSCYYALFPTNAAWKAQFDENVKYFQYDKQVVDRDSFMYVYPRYNILAGAQFSKTRNPKLGVTEDIDSIVSPLAIAYSLRKIAYGSYDVKKYQWEQPYKEGGIFTGATSTQCSNGVVLKTDEWKINRKTTFLDDIIMEAESNRTLDSLSGATQQAKPAWIMNNVPSDNPFYNKVSNNCFYTLLSTTATLPGVLLDFTNVLSNVKYDMYVVTVPAIAADTLATDTLPTRFAVTLYWHDATGKEVSVKVDDKNGADISYDESARRYTFLTDPTRVHNIKIGTFEFPTCSYGLDEPQVKAYIEVSLRNSDVTKGLYTKNLRIDQIKLVPHVDE